MSAAGMFREALARSFAASASRRSTSLICSRRSTSLMCSRFYGGLKTSDGDIPSDGDITSDGDIAMSRLLKHRIVFLKGAIRTGTANVLIGQLLFLNLKNPSKPIHLHIDSPGGSITAGMAIYDVMQYIRCPVTTLCIGRAAAMASLLLTAGAAGERRACLNASVKISQPFIQLSVQAPEYIIHVKYLIKFARRYNALYAKHTGQPVKLIEKYMNRDTFFNPEKAKEFGLIDHIIEDCPSSDDGSSGR